MACQDGGLARQDAAGLSGSAGNTSQGTEGDT